MYGIWLFDGQDWLREPPSAVAGGVRAVLAFESHAAAQTRAARHFGFASYAAAFGHGYCEVRPIPIPGPHPEVGQ